LVKGAAEPSASEIEKAVRADMDQSNQQEKNIGGGLIADNMLTKVYGVKKLGCVAAQGASGFNCDVEIDVSAPFVGRSKKVGQLRFVKGSDGWKVVMTK
jgi:hypothetical protein